MGLKNLNHFTFHNAFERLVRADDPDRVRRRWVKHGLDWDRSRHAFYGPDYSVSTEVTVVRRRGARGFGIMVVREGWWAEDRGDPIKTREWVHVLSGQRPHVLSYFDDLFTQAAQAPGERNGQHTVVGSHSGG